MAGAVTFDLLFEALLLFSNSGYFMTEANWSVLLLFIASKLLCLLFFFGFFFEAFKETISILHEVCRTEQLR